MASLHESLTKFKKQQEKCQTTLTSIAAKVASSRATTNQKATTASAPSSTNTKSPAPAVKFSNDTERLQHINSIRKAPVGAQIKRIIDLLLEARQFLSRPQVEVHKPRELAFLDGTQILFLRAPSAQLLDVPIKVDDDLRQLFRGIELPRDMLDIEKDLQKNGMKPATNTAKRRAMAQVHGIGSKPKPKKKKHEITKRTKLTNAHLPELFQHLNVPGS
ncbi:GTPase [Actinidia chinensis var. chinensis]|uniref:GTPase n=1 Tax=Actinidia chinensis var. chinensis TaxID=1590841 RepID=A0A2R6QNC2_ACTCC|nr:GTPase [Actinidia chinensis var. chinensis]